jgi:excisionase family DNA binding protein
MTTETEPRLAYRPEEAARALGCSRATVFKLLSAGELRGWRIGAARLISADEIRRFIHEREQEGRNA